MSVTQNYQCGDIQICAICHRKQSGVSFKDDENGQLV